MKMAEGQAAQAAEATTAEVGVLWHVRQTTLNFATGCARLVEFFGKMHGKLKHKLQRPMRRGLDL